MEQVKHPIAFIEFSGQTKARELSQLIKLFLEGRGYRITYLSEKVEGTTLVIYDKD